MPAFDADAFAASGALRLRLANEILSANQHRPHNGKLPELMAVADLTYGAVVCYFGALAIDKEEAADIKGDARKAMKTGYSYITADGKGRVKLTLRLHTFEQYPTMSEADFNAVLHEARNLIREIRDILENR